jgi:hypothetical protein
MKRPEKLSPGGHRGEAEQQAKAHDTQPENITAIILPLRSLPGWHIAMRRAHAIRRYKGRAKVSAVKLWRVAVVDALGVRQ